MLVTVLRPSYGLAALRGTGTVHVVVRAEHAAALEARPWSSLQVPAFVLPRDN